MQQIDKLMNAGNAGQFASLTTYTRVGIVKTCGKIVKGSRALKEGELELTKRSKFVTQTKTSYVKRATAKDSSFTIKPRTWGERVSLNLVKHKGGLYLETIHNPDSNLAKPETIYFLNGAPIDKEELESLYDCASIQPRPSASGIDVRTFKAESIEQVKLNGQTIAA